MRIHLYMVALAATIWAAPCLAQDSSHPPVEAFATLPTISDPVLSPDGKYLAMIQDYKGRPAATIRQLDSLAAPPVVIPYTDGFIVGVDWANDHRLLITINLNARVLGDDVNPWFRTVAIDPDGQNPVVLFKNQTEARDINYSASIVADLALNDPDHIYMPLFSPGMYLMEVWEPPHSRLFRVDVNSGNAVPVVGGTKDTVSWVMDGSGNVAARVDQTKSPLTDHVLVYTPDKDWREIASVDASQGKGFRILGLSSDGKSLVMHTAPSDGGPSGYALMSLADGKITGFTSDPLFDLSGVLRDPWSGRVIGTSVIAHDEQDTYFDAKYQEMQGALNDTFQGLSAHALHWDLAFDRIIVSVDGPVTPPTYYLFTPNTHRFQTLGHTYSQLKAPDLGQIRVYDYKARDGLNIPAYLTLPPNKEAKNLPVVILPHGGPQARDDMSFDWESQFLANRGYAVLRPNFRGSSGYGRKFEAAGYGQWGLKMQDDVTDGVKKLIADGIADPKRICIVGGSYGGYAALAAAAFTPDLYACAAAWAPVTDLRQMLLTDKHDAGGEDSWLISAEQIYIGDRSKDADKLDAASPAENAAKITAPVLLMHGEADATVRIDQSEAMEQALHRAGKKVTFIRIPKETHHMQAQDTRVRWLSELEKFLKENIGN